MSAFSENKFLAVFGGVMLVGVGTLGYLTMGASSDYDQAKSAYDDAAAKLRSLHDSKPSPMQENVDAYVARQKTLKGQIDKLQKDLAVIEVKYEPISATGFQDKLKDSVAKFVTRSDEVGMKRPEKFYLGFDEYQSAPPRDAAAPHLLRELRGLELALEPLLQSKNVELKKITRTELLEEKKQVEPAKPDKSRPRPEDDKKLVQRMSFQIEFLAPQETFQRTLNGIVANSEQFFIVRNVSIKNEKPEPPSKENKAAAGAVDPSTGTPVAPAPDAVAGAPGEAAPKQTLEKIFGSERVEVLLDIDMLDFADPETAGPDKSTSNKPK
jgi:hypothetical protein